MIVGSTRYSLDHDNRHARRSTRQHARHWCQAINYRNLFLRFIGGNARYP